jgi:hypothetical protein
VVALRSENEAKKKTPTRNGPGFWHLPEKKLKGVTDRLTELQRLGCHGLLVVAEAATEPDCCSDDDGAS